MVIEGSQEVKNPPLEGLEENKGDQGKPPLQPSKRRTRPPISSQSPQQRKKRFDSQFEVLDTTFQNANSEDVEARVTLLKQKQDALKSRLDEIHSQDMRFRKHYWDSTEELAQWSGQLQQKDTELEAKIENSQKTLQTELKSDLQKQLNSEIDLLHSRTEKLEKDILAKSAAEIKNSQMTLRTELKSDLQNQLNSEIDRLHSQLDQDILTKSAALQLEANQRSEDLKQNILNELNQGLGEKLKIYINEIVTEKLRKQEDINSRLKSNIAEQKKNQESMYHDLETLKKSAINQEQLGALEGKFKKEDDKLWQNVNNLFVGKSEYDALDGLAIQLAKRTETLEIKCEALEKKAASPRFAIELNEKRMVNIEKGILELRLNKDDRYKEVEEKLASVTTEMRVLNGKIVKLNEDLQDFTKNSQDPSFQLSFDSQIKLKKEISEQLEELNSRLLQNDKKINAFKDDLLQRAFFDPKLMKGMNDELKSRIEHLSYQLESLKSIEIAALENRQTIVETALVDQGKPQQHVLIIDSFYQKVNDMISSLQELREQNALEKAEVSNRLEKIEKVQTTEIEKLRLMVHEVYNESAINLKISSLEAKMRDLNDGHQREQQRIAGLSQKQSDLSLQINEQTQNLNFLQTQTKGYQTREETNREWRLTTENAVKKIQTDLKEMKMFIDSHHGGIKHLDGQSEELRKEVILIKTACANLEHSLININNGLETLVDTQNKNFMQKIQETIDALQSNSERFQTLLTSEVQKIDEKFIQLEHHLSTLARNSFHLSRSFEQEESKRMSPPLQAEPINREMKDSKSSPSEAYQGRFPGLLFDSKKKPPFEEGYRGGIIDERPSITQEEGYHGRLSGFNFTQQTEIQHRQQQQPQEGYRSRITDDVPSISRQEGYPSRVSGINFPQQLEYQPRLQQQTQQPTQPQQLQHQIQQLQQQQQHQQQQQQPQQQRAQRNRLVLENPEDERFDEIQRQPNTSFLQPPSHQHLLSLLPSSSLQIPPSTSHLQSQNQAESRITREERELSESTQQKIPTQLPTSLKKNIVADLFSSKNKQKRDLH